MAQAVSGPDEDVAAELERSAGSSSGPWRIAASAAFLERATALTLNPASRGRRALAAAQANQLGGASTAALRMLAVAETAPLDDLYSAPTATYFAPISPFSDGGAMLLGYC